MISHPPMLRFLLALGLLGAGCPGLPGFRDDKGKNSGAAEAEVRPAPVVTTTSKLGPIAARLSAASTIEAERMVTVHAESTGRLVDLAIEEGDDVTAGQLLGRIKADMQNSGVDRAATNLAQTKRELETTRGLFARRVASQQELDNAELAYKQALLDVADRRRDLRNTKILAPIGGTVTERLVNEGAFVTSGAAIAAIVDFSSLVARVYVPEQALDRIALGQPAEVVGKASGTRRGEGTVLRIAPVVDATTGTVKVTVALPPATANIKGFLPGMYAEVTMTTDRHDDAVLVPKQALVHDDDGVYLFVVEGDKAKRQRVTLGLVDDDRAEILTGLVAGAEIVESGQAGLKDHAPIERVDAAGRPIADAPAGDSAQARVGDPAGPSHAARGEP